MRRWTQWTFLGFILLGSGRVRADGGLTLNGGSVVITGPAALSTTGDIVLASGTLQAVGNAQFSLDGNWSQIGSGIFLSGQSTVVLAGNSTLSGTNSFYNLSALTAGQTLTFPGGLTQTVTHTFTLSGAAGNLSAIRSSSPGSFAFFSNPGSSAISYANVQDNDAIGGNVLNAGIHSVLLHTVNWSYGGPLLAPQAVTQVHRGGVAALTYSWTPVTTYANGVSVPDGIGTTYAVNEYADLSDLSTKTSLSLGSWVNAYGPIAESQTGSTAFYGISAVIDGVTSDLFYVDNNAAPNYAYPASNGNGYVLVPQALQSAFTGAASPFLWLSLNTQVSQTSAGVLASGSLEVQTRDSENAPPGYDFPPPGATLVLKKTIQTPINGATAPVQLNVNGTWKTVGTAAYSPSQNTFTFTVYQTGLYRVGTDDVGAAATLPVLQSVHPRIFSPNGDGYNDVVYFDLNNSGLEPASGSIFDLRTAKVAALQSAPLGLKWDGRGPDGRVVPGGVYIYQINVGGRRINGTVVVVK